jgi:hypothetical protein
MVQLPEEECRGDCGRYPWAELDAEKRSGGHPGRAPTPLPASILVEFTVGLYSLFLFSGDNGTNHDAAGGGARPKG